MAIWNELSDDLKKAIVDRLQTSGYASIYGLWKGWQNVALPDQILEEKVTDLYIANATSISGVEKLKNLTRVTVSCNESSYKSETKIKVQDQYLPKDKRRPSISYKDLWALAKCEKLESLGLYGQNGIEEIDCRDFKNLKKLIVNNCDMLERIDHVEEMTNLAEISLVGNEQLNEVNNLDILLCSRDENNFKSELDVSLFSEAIGQNKKRDAINNSQHRGTYCGRVYDDEALQFVYRNSDKFKWKENVEYANGERVFVELATDEMLSMHQRALNIAKEIFNPLASDVENIMAAHLWTANNIEYSFQPPTSVTKISGGNFYFAQSHLTSDGKGSGTNTTYDTLMLGAGVCEGYSRVMKLLLDTCGIKTTTVSCFAYTGEDAQKFVDVYKEDGEYKSEIIDEMFAINTRSKDATRSDFDPARQGGFHSILRVPTDSGYYYCDPTWDNEMDFSGSYPNNTPRYMLLTAEEMRKRMHLLSSHENGISSNQSLYKENSPREFKYDTNTMRYKSALERVSATMTDEK